MMGNRLIAPPKEQGKANGILSGTQEQPRPLKRIDMQEEMKQVANIVAAAEGAIAELQEVCIELPLMQIRKHLQEAINLLSEAEESLNKAESEAEDGE